MNTPIKKRPSFYVTMLGDFSVSLGRNTVSDHDNQSKKPWIILEYLITFRKRDIPANELIDLIWAGDRSRNPQGALKTLVFRSRQLLNPLGYPSQHIVIQKNGSYAWSGENDTVVDVDVFEQLANRILDVRMNYDTPDALLADCLKALDIYKGDFLTKARYEPWVVPISAYYHSLFQQVLYKTLEILNQKEDYNKIVELCSRAIVIEPYDEEIHYNLIYALYQSGQQKKALDHYTETTDMFYREFSITPSERFKSLYKMIQDTEHGITMDLSIVRDRLQEESTHGGAYCCEYSVFKDIYQLECRSIERTGDSIFLCMISLSDSEGELFKAPVLAKAMDELGNAIRLSLRRGDVYTRFSISQYLFLLPSVSYENADMVLKRIIRCFKKEYTRKDMSIYSSLLSLAIEKIAHPEL
jgi:DNA-binding SARP family transcriptional activator